MRFFPKLPKEDRRFLSSYKEVAEKNLPSSVTLQDTAEFWKRYRIVESPTNMQSLLKVPTIISEFPKCEKLAQRI